MKLSPFAGDNNFTAFPLDTVLERLKEIQQLTDQDVSSLGKLCATLKAENVHRSHDLGRDQREQFANYSLTQLERASTELIRLLQEIPLGVRSSHARAVLALYNDSCTLKQRCLNFNRECCRIADYIAEEIYKTVMSHILDFLDLDSISSRLEELEGTSIAESRNRPPKSAESTIDQKHILALTQRDAVEMLIATFPDLNESELHAGMMHTKGVTWDDMMAKCKCSRATLKKLIDQFYDKTKFARQDRRLGKGTKVSLIEDHDTDIEHPEHPEHS